MHFPTLGTSYVPQRCTTPSREVMSGVFFYSICQLDFNILSNICHCFSLISHLSMTLCLILALFPPWLWYFTNWSRFAQKGAGCHGFHSPHILLFDFKGTIWISRLLICLGRFPQSGLLLLQVFGLWWWQQQPIFSQLEVWRGKQGGKCQSLTIRHWALSAFDLSHAAKFNMAIRV